MTRKEKLLQKFKQNPAAIKYSELRIVLTHLEFKEITAKGSHVKWKHPALPKDLIIPVHNNDCKPFYKKSALKLLQEHQLLPL